MSEVSRKSHFEIVQVDHTGCIIRLRSQMLYPDIPGNKKLAKQRTKLMNKHPHLTYKLRRITEIIEEF